MNVMRCWVILAIIQAVIIVVILEHYMGIFPRNWWE